MVKKNITRRPKRGKRREKKNTQKRRKGIRKGGLPPTGIPDPIFPTAEQLLRDIGLWRKISCLKYKNGSVMVVEDSEDTNNIASCDLIDFHTTIEDGILYQYVLFRDDEKKNSYCVNTISNTRNRNKTYVPFIGY